MEYTLMLCFDKETEARFNTIIASIAEAGVSSYMIDAKIPPHISVACFVAEDIQPVIHALDAHVSSLGAGDIVWPSLGMFVPRVLFAAPVLNEYLLHVCIDLNRLIEPLSSVGAGGFYTPYHWVPHTTLALELTHDALQKAADIASRQFSFIAGRANRLKLVAFKCELCNDIKTWDLG